MRLNGIFKDNMVFQRNAQIRVFGVADANAVSVLARIMDGDKILSEGIADYIEEDSRSFVIELDALPAGGPYTLWVDSQVNEITIHNVYIGEVWLAGGQSNMEYILGRSANASEVVPSCPRTSIHYYNVPVSDKVDDELVEAEKETRWYVVDSDTCYNMSGIAFYFALKVQEVLSKEENKDLHFAVIGCYLGGSSVSCWQSVETLGKTEEGRKYLEEFRSKCESWSSREEYLAAEAKYLDECEVFENKVNAVLKTQPYISYFDVEKITGPGAWPPPVGPLSVRRPGSLYEGMLTRIIPFAVKGVIFYQGEEDTGAHGEDYAVVFGTMIAQWREVFRDENLPFVFCGLPKFPPEGGPEEAAWESVRQQQRLVAQTVPDTYIADIYDCGEIGNVHPSDKKTPGDRLAALALKHVYGLDY